MNRDSLATAIVRLLFVALSFPAQAQLSFFEPPTYAGSGTFLPGYGYVFVADFNGDSKPDLLTTDGTLNLGKGDGTFTLGTNVLGTSGIQVMGVADFDGDVKPDVLEQYVDQSLQVLLGNGDGTFRTAANNITSISNIAVPAADLNGDGRADLLTLSNTLSNSTLYVYLGNGDGTFKSGISYDLGSISARVLSLGDYNGDNITDVALSATGQEIVLLGNGDGTFQAPRTSVGNLYTGGAVVGDFNGDGKLDLAVDGTVLLGNGDGTFQAPLNTGVSGQMAAGDFDGDGKLDLVSRTQIYLGNGDGTFSATGRAYLIQSDSNTVIADFNDDGKLDIAVGNTVLLGNGNGTFQGNPSSVGVVGLLEQWDVVTGDFDNNGSIDVAVSSLSNVPILVNDSTGQLSVNNTYSLQLGYDNAVVSGDFNSDGNLDLIVVTNQPNGADPWIWSYSVLLGNGDGTFHTTFYPMGNASGPSQPMVVVDDFNNDGKLDFEVSLLGYLYPGSLFLGNGDGTFAAPIEGQIVTSLRGDFNGDGYLDVAWAYYTATTVSTAIQFGNGDGTFQAPFFPPELQGLIAYLVVDLNIDGRPDLVCGTSNSVSQVALGNGDGTFTVLAPLSNGISVITDLNGDGRPDAVYQTASSTKIAHIGVMLGNGDGAFGSPIDVFSTAFYQRVLVADMNGDGRPDLVFVGYGGVGVLLNTTAPGFELWASALSAAPVIAGGSATSTVTILPMFGFNNSVTLSCGGLPSGAACSFSPPSIANSSGTSTLTVTTSASTGAGTYPLQVRGKSGLVVGNAALSLVVQAQPDFTIGDVGSGTSQTISAGQTANFSLAFTPTGTFSGTVNLTCAINPAATPAPTCSVPSSVQISGTGRQTATVKVGTTAPVTAGAVHRVIFSVGPLPLAWRLMFLGSAWLWLRNRKRLPAIATTLVVLAFMFLVGCGGSGSSSHTTAGTPAGTYTVTVTATSGSTNHNIALQVVVQ